MNEKETFDWGIIVNFKKKNPKNPEKEKTVIIVDILLHVAKKSTEGNPIPCHEGDEGEVEVVPVLHSLISQISSLRLYYPKDLRPSDNRKSVLKTIQEVKKRFPEGPPLLNPIEDMKIKDDEFKTIIQKIEQLEERMFQHPMHKVTGKETFFVQYINLKDSNFVHLFRILSLTHCMNSLWSKKKWQKN